MLGRLAVAALLLLLNLKATNMHGMKRQNAAA